MSGRVELWSQYLCDGEATGVDFASDLVTNAQSSNAFISSKLRVRERKKLRYASVLVLF